LDDLPVLVAKRGDGGNF